MTVLDPSHERVLALDPTRNARVLGAPGTGKSTLVVELCARALAGSGSASDELVVLAAGRGPAAQLRNAIEQRVDRAMPSAPVRTAAALGFQLLRQVAAQDGRPQPRLLTGLVHDETIAAVVDEALEPLDGCSIIAGLDLAPEVLRSAPFRAEMREFSRVVDEYGVAPESFRRTGPTRGRADSGVLDPALARQWGAALELDARVRERLRRSRPEERSASELLRDAAEAVEAGRVGVPGLVLVDDAQELGEGALRLLAALAGRGARVWVFGDPDVATSAFHGERTGVLSGLDAELRRAGAPESALRMPEQEVVLERAHRHGPVLREWIGGLTARIGAAGAGAQRSALAAEREARIEFARVSSAAEQIGALAHRLRARHLGLESGSPVAWNRMAVLCRSRAEVARTARLLAAQQVPTGVAAGGVILREHQLVRELIRLLQHALGIAPLRTRDLLDLLGGEVGGLDPVAVRRLRGELRLQELRGARADERAPRSTDEVIAAAFAEPRDRPVVDSRGGRRLRRLGRLAAAGRARAESGGTAREVLWEIWHGTGLADELQGEALDQRGARSDEAHRALDAVLGLFFALQRHEEQDSPTPIPELLQELLVSTVPEDSLAARSQRDVVTVTTPQGAIGQEFDVVCVLGVQDGVWPNLRARGSMLGVTALERWLRGGGPAAPSRADTRHDELRLFVHACARAVRELLVVAIADEEHYPSAFFGLGRSHLRERPLPTTRLTLRGAVAEMRRRQTTDPADGSALASLVALAEAGVPGAHPEEWYGVRPSTTSAPLVDLEGDPDAVVPVSPSRIESVERCPLDWAISQLGGGSPGVAQGIGTLVHRAFEEADGAPSADQLMDRVLEEWDELVFDAAWESDRQRARVAAMTEGLADYLAEFEGSDRTLVGREARLVLRVGRAQVRGTVDRLEARTREDGRTEVSIIDLKTGGKKPSESEVADNAQLQAYQLGLVRGGVELSTGERVDANGNGGASLLYVHPDVRTTTGAAAGQTFRRFAQALLDAEREAAAEARITAAAEVMAGAEFVARIEHHCMDPHGPSGACRLHVIPPVSRA